jgi:hypothetical protein
VCKDLDKLEMILQASEYEDAQSMELQEFFDSTAGQWRTEHGCASTDETGTWCGCSCLLISSKPKVASAKMTFSTFVTVYCACTVDTHRLPCHPTMCMNLVTQRGCLH